MLSTVIHVCPNVPDWRVFTDLSIKATLQSLESAPKLANEYGCIVWLPAVQYFKLQLTSCAVLLNGEIYLSNTIYSAYNCTLVWLEPWNTCFERSFLQFPNYGWSCILNGTAMLLLMIPYLELNIIATAWQFSCTWYDNASVDFDSVSLDTLESELEWLTPFIYYLRPFIFHTSSCTVFFSLTYFAKLWDSFLVLVELSCWDKRTFW